MIVELRVNALRNIVAATPPAHFTYEIPLVKQFELSVHLEGADLAEARQSEAL